MNQHIAPVAAYGVFPDSSSCSPVGCLKRKRLAPTTIAAVITNEDQSQWSAKIVHGPTK
jgi:hypothetical protein